ncbi:helix-turn-helix domain-containing protein [Streptomyces sp. 110]|uniref:Helix-turn-helix domain-containing protein n=1 Tax=Streptomyces endocoffeicus TaxID=2898945 RepID=A0ABS1PFG5_9ACTN|nr:helix-turn-helix transcriptional regulator [Streptomyces endocoffeicus]MBL1110910.1 helix-turn-helix domain-containing protein [Streptomyces endocoffeicus]
MGRTLSAHAEADLAVGLAQWLRSLRRQAGLTYQQMAHTTQAGFAPATLWRAARGTTVPRWPVVEAFATACGGDLEQARRMWAAAAEQRRSLRSAVPSDRGEPVLRPEFIHNPAQLLQSMRAMQLEAGGLSLRELEDRATSHGVTLLPHSTVGAVLRGERMPSRMLLIHFVQACGVSRAPTGAWEDAWARADAYRRWATGSNSRSAHRGAPGAQHDDHQHVRAA